MTSRQLFNSLQYLDDALVEVPDTRPTNKTVWIRWGAAAAVFALIVGAVFALPRLRHNGEPQPVGVPGGELNWTEPPQSMAGEPQPVGVPGADALLPEAAKPTVLAWNELDEARASYQADVAGVAMASEPLTAAQTAACTPEIQEEWMTQFNGIAYYYLKGGAGGLAYIELTLQNAAWGGNSTIRIRDKDTPDPPQCYVQVRETDHVGSYGGQEYRAYRLNYLHGEGDPATNPPEAWTELTVVFEKENVVYTLYANVPQTQEELAAMDLRDLLLCYAGTHNVPDLSAFHCGEHVYRDEELTFAEGLADPDFGAYLPAAGPEGYDLDMLRRYQLEDTIDYLMAVWFKPQTHGELVWLIKPTDAEGLSRVVDPAEPETYDWNRYPTPWSAYAAQENWLTIENPVFRIDDLTPDLIATRVHIGDEGLAMCRFGVLLESGIIIEINSKDVPAEWIYESIIQARQ